MPNYLGVATDAAAFVSGTIDGAVIGSKNPVAITGSTISSTGNMATGGNHTVSGALVSSGVSVGAKSPAPVTATVGTVLTAAQMLTGNILRSGPAAAYTDTTDTAAAIVASIPGAQIGMGYELSIANTVAFAATIAAGAGVTLAGTTALAASSSRKFVVTITAIAIPAVTLTGISSGTL